MVVTLGGINDDNNDYCLDYNDGRPLSDGGSSAIGEQQQGGRCMKKEDNEQEKNDTVEHREAAAASTSQVRKKDPSCSGAVSPSQPFGAAAGVADAGRTTSKSTSSILRKQGHGEDTPMNQQTKKLTENEPAGISNSDSKSTSVIHSSAHSKKNSPKAKTPSSRRRPA